MQRIDQNHCSAHFYSKATRWMWRDINVSKAIQVNSGACPLRNGSERNAKCCTHEVYQFTSWPHGIFLAHWWVNSPLGCVYTTLWANRRPYHADAATWLHQRRSGVRVLLPLVKKNARTLRLLARHSFWYEKVSGCFLQLQQIAQEPQWFLRH